MNFHLFRLSSRSWMMKKLPFSQNRPILSDFFKVKIRFSVFVWRWIIIWLNLTFDSENYQSSLIIKPPKPLLVSFVLLEIIRKDWWNYFASNAAIRVKESFGKHWEVALFPWIGALSICNWCCAILNSGRHLSPKMTLEWIFFFHTKSSSNVSLSFDSRQKQRVLWMQHSTFIMVLHSRSSTSYKGREEVDIFTLIQCQFPSQSW